MQFHYHGELSRREKFALRRKELGSRGYRGVRTHYSAARMAANVLEIYESLVSDSAIEIR